MKRLRKTIRHPETLRKKHFSDSYASFDRKVDLHGMTAIEAERVIKNVLSSAGEKILINHGKGEGILRTLVRKICSSDHRVKSICKGEESVVPGGDGITIIQL